MKPYYLFNPVTGEAAGIYEAQESPLEEGVYITPTASTDIEPPNTGANEVAVFNNGVWVTQPDFRGETIYSTVTGEVVAVEYIGPQPANTTDQARPSVAHDWGGLAWVLNTAKAQVQLTAALSAAVQSHLDAAAQAMGYDNIVSVCSYAGAPNPFQVEGQSFVAWRGAVWDSCYALLAQVQAGTAPIPTEAALIAQLPVRVV